MRRAVLAAIIGGLFVGCGTSAPKPQTKILEAGACWYEVERCHRQIQLGDGRVIPICFTEWESRCREAELERYLRDGCRLVRLPDERMIAVACGGVK